MSQGSPKCFETGSSRASPKANHRNSSLLLMHLPDLMYIRTTSHPVLDPAYHRLLFETVQSAPISHPPLTYLSGFFECISPSPPPSHEILSSAGRSFQLLYTGTGKLHKAELWAEVWSRMTAFLSHLDTASARHDSCADAMTVLVRLVCDGLTESIQLSQNGKKVSALVLQCLTSSI